MVQVKIRFQNMVIFPIHSGMHYSTHLCNPFIQCSTSVFPSNIFIHEKTKFSILFVGCCSKFALRLLRTHWDHTSLSVYTDELLCWRLCGWPSGSVCTSEALYTVIGPEATPVSNSRRSAASRFLSLTFVFTIIRHYWKESIKPRPEAPRYPLLRQLSCGPRARLEWPI